MKRKTFITFIILAMALVFAMPLSSQVPQLINYQARLTDPATNLPVADGEYTINFSIYDMPEEGIPLWTETQTVQTTNGIYSVLLGSLNPIDAAIFPGSARYLGVTVGSDPEMTPRKQMVSVSYAFHSKTADTVTGTISETDPTWKGAADTIASIGRTGNVGIGTTSPAALLHTHGTGTGEGNVLFSGSFKSSSPGDPPASGAGTRMMWYPDKAAFRAGYVYNNNWNKDSIGDYSVAMGYDTKAIGSHSIAIGHYTTASGESSTAMGDRTTASGDYSTAMGYNTTASGPPSTAMGSNTTASGYNSTAMGYNTIASGASSTAMGYSTTASNLYSTSMGYSTTASGWYSTAMGYSTTASGSPSTAMGSNTTASGYNSTAIGYSTIASGASSTAMGCVTTASNFYSTAMGYNTTASGSGSTAMGYGTTAPSAYEMTIGSYNTGYTPASTTAWNTNDRIFVIGRGTGSSDRLNAMTILKNGNTGLGTDAPTALLHTNGTGTGAGNVLFAGEYKSSSPGDPPTSGLGTRMMWYPDKAAFRVGYVQSNNWDKDSVGNYSSALGYDTKAKGYYCIAMGAWTTASNYASTAIGDHTTASGNRSTAMGSYSNAIGDYSFAINLDYMSGPNVGARTFRISGASAIGGNLAWTNYSDRRLKKDIQTLNTENNLEKIMQLNGVRFRWKDNETLLNLGFLGQQVKDIIPESVRYDELNDIYSMEYTAIIPVLVEGIKEQQEVIDKQNSRIETQQSEIKSLQQKIDELYELIKNK